MRRLLIPSLFVGTLFVSASLLFSVQPLIGKLLLPKFGGAASVWAACMFFFQAALLLGYGYAHLATRWLSPKGQVLLQGALLMAPLLVLPIGLSSQEPPPRDGNPSLFLLGLLLTSAGLPFLVVSTSSPLLQRWFTETGHPAARDPYFLNAASNTGSMLALLSYPTLIEPNLAVLRQSQIWACGYGLLVLLVGMCGLVVWRRGTSLDAVESESGDSATTGPTAAIAKRGGRAKLDEQPAPLSGWTRMRWVALAFAPSSLVLGVTTYLTTNIAPVPLMWIIPLTLYLLSFILVFSRLPAAVHWGMVAALPMVVIGLAWVMFETPSPLSIRETIALNLVTFFVAAMVCHGELASSRPSPRHLTEFYWWIAVGGVLGGIFNAFAAPLVFTTLAEYPLAIVLSLAMAPSLPGKFRGTWKRRLIRAAPFLMAAVAGGVFWVKSQRPENDGVIVFQERNFFGILTVKEVPSDHLMVLNHGNICHGLQLHSPDPRFRRLPMTYFFPTGPIGQIFSSFQVPHAKSNVAVIGLGAGSLASYADQGQAFTFYELDPAVPPIAEDTRYFTFLSDARQRGALLNIVLGDARISLEQAAESAYELIILDAFSGDAIPVHLLTREALQLYLQKLKRGGLLALHISNVYVNLAPVLGDLAQALGLIARVQVDDSISAADAGRGKTPSIWVVIGRQETDLGPLASDSRWRPLVGREPPSLWTDDYSNVFSVFR